jgi:hypothetical protein
MRSVGTIKTARFLTPVPAEFTTLWLRRLFSGTVHSSTSSFGEIAEGIDV